MRNLIISLCIISSLTLSGCAVVAGVIGGAAVVTGVDCWKTHTFCNEPELKLDTVTESCCAEKKECCDSKDAACCQSEKKLDPKTESAIKK